MYGNGQIVRRTPDDGYRGSLRIASRGKNLQLGYSKCFSVLYIAVKYVYSRSNILPFDHMDFYSFASFRRTTDHIRTRYLDQMLVFFSWLLSVKHCDLFIQFSHVMHAAYAIIMLFLSRIKR